MSAGPLIVLSGGAGRTFIETGLVVIRETHARLFSGRPLESERDILNNITIHHEWIHYVQSFTCAAVHYAAQQLLHLAEDAVGAAQTGHIADQTQKRLRELTEELYGRRANEPIQIVDRPGATLMIPVPDSDQIGMLDLLEGVAVLESFKLCTEHADVNHFLQFRDRHFGGSERSVYRWSFNWLADAIGADGTYELLAPVSFLALQSTDPSREFTQIVKQLARVGRRDYQKLADIETLSATLYPRGWKSWLEAFANGEPTSGHVTLDKCAAFAVGQLGVRQATQLAATPSRVTAETFAALCPPVTAYSGEESVTLTIPDYARNGLAEAVIDWTAIVGAAERLTMLTDVDVYQFCPHTGCPHYESALCHRVFAPPGVNSQHERCRFPATFRTHARLEPRDAWTAVGRQRKSLADVIAEFEETYEAGLLALARRERASLVGWLGEDAYKNIEGKCQATAEKAMRALRTQKINDVIEARAFRDAVVAELRRLYATVSESA